MSKYSWFIIQYCEVNTLEALLKINNCIHSAVWGNGMVVFMLAVGIFFTVFTGFFQFVRFKDIMKNTVGSLFGKKNNASGITPFQAVSTALAGTIGTGNIAGVATAITLGGAGAIFWMWISGIFGMMTKYAEVLLAVRFRKADGKHGFSGGPMYYMEYGLSSKTLGIIFSVLCIAASFGTGNMAQSNSIADALLTAFLIPPEISGIILAAVCALIIAGGAPRIARFSEIIVPFMAIFYLTGAVIFLVYNRSCIPAALNLIINGAFTPGGAFGGIAGSAVRYGISRGIFTNEAGMGSAPIAHGSADTDSPVRQGMWGIFEVFLDTIVVCTVTALVILTADGGKFYTCGMSGVPLTSGAFSTLYGSFGASFISVAVVFFALASILGWAFYGQKSVEYITKKRLWLSVYRVVFIGFVFLGAISDLELAWSISDTLNGLMAIPNLTAVLLLSPIVFRLTRKYRRGTTSRGKKNL